LDAEERQAFLTAAREQERERRTFCETLYFTGCRVTEALEMTPKRVEIKAGQIILRSLKKRREDVFRAVPVPAEFLDTLEMVHDIKQSRRRPKVKDAPLWNWTRVHSWRMVKEVMIQAGIADGPHQSAKGLRHSFGVHATVSGVPLNMLCKWMGHADIKTTAIYANAMGKEEQNIAARMW
jgi:integrase/recombinase XerD